MKQLLHIASIVLITYLALSCKRQELCSLDTQSDNAAINISIDWSESAIDQDEIYNVSAYAYPEGGGSPYLKISGNTEQVSMNLPSGVYSLLVFNDMVDDIKGMNFVDVDSRDEFRAEVLADESLSMTYYSVRSEEALTQSIGELAAWRMEEFEVSEDMVWCSYCGETYDASAGVYISISPTTVTVPCIVTLYVENLDNASSIEGVVKGLAGGAYLFSNDRTQSGDVIDLYSIYFTSRTYDEGSSQDGTAIGRVITFGKNTSEDQTYELALEIVLNSGEKVSFTRDITEQVEAQSDIEIVINLTSDDNKISLPESAGTGFGVESWGDNESVELL